MGTVSGGTRRRRGSSRRGVTAFHGVDASGQARAARWGWQVAVAVGIAVAVALVMVAPPALADEQATTDRMSVAEDGTGANGQSRQHSISADGRFVVFDSAASNLVSGDTNEARDVFLRDRQEGTIERVSVADDGSQAERESFQPDISGDGRYVVFGSRANNLVEASKNAPMNVFIRDRQAGTTEMVSVADDGTPGNAKSKHPVVSDDGRFVAFQSAANNFVSEDTLVYQVFVRDRQEGTTEVVSVHDDGTPAGDHHREGTARYGVASKSPKISADGQLVAFTSKDGNLHDRDSDRGEKEHPPGVSSVYVRDRGAQTTELAAVDSDGTPANAGSAHAALSADGTVVAFTSGADNLVPGDTNDQRDVFVHERDTGVTERVSVASNATQSAGWSRGAHLGKRALSAHGEVITFRSAARNLVAGDTNGVSDVFRHDRRSGGTERVSVAADGSQGNAVAGYVNDHGKYLFPPSMSRDGQVVAFLSQATNLVAGDTNELGDTYVRANEGPRLSLGMQPADAEGGEHTVTATVTDDDGEPMAGETVEFAVSGAQAASGSATTNEEGSATFAYTGQEAGRDEITAFADLDASGGEDDGEPAATIHKVWLPDAVELTPAESADLLVGDEHEVTAVATDKAGEAVAEIPLEFRVSGASASTTDPGSATTDGQGQASFAYTGPTAGEDTITVFADANGNDTQDDAEPGATVTATWQNSEERQTGTWSEGGQLRLRRAAATATRLGDRGVLLVGGWRNSGTAELWDPATRQSRLVDAPEETGQIEHTATRLADGSVLAVGGARGRSGSAPVAAVETFDPDEEGWTSATSMNEARAEHTATRLADGRVLVAGGRASDRFDNDSQVQASAEIYNPESDTWEPAGSMKHPRFRHTATLLDDGRVLVMGGSTGSERLDSAEVFDPDGGEDGSGAWSTVEAMSGPRVRPATTKLATGDVLVTGGSDDDGPKRSVEVFNPDSESWQAAASMHAPRSGHTIEMLGDGTALVVGRADGLGSERYDPEADVWWSAGGGDRIPRNRMWSTVLANGQVLAGRDAAKVYSPQDLPTPEVTSVSPRVGSVDGGFEVTVTGEHLSDTHFGYFGDRSAVEVTQVSPEEVRLVAPEHQPGEVSVTVSTPGGVSEPSEAATVTFEAYDGQWQRTAGDTTTQRPAGVGMITLGGAVCEGPSAPGYCGQVLQVSGETSELYEPQSQQFGGSAKLPFSEANVANRMTTLDGPACRGSGQAPDYCGEVLAVDNGGSEGVARYDPTTNSWQELQPMPNEQKVNHLVVLDGPACRGDGEAPDHCGKVLAGTHDPGISFDFNMPRMWLYDPGANEWTERTQPTEKRKSYAMTLVDGPACDGDEPPAACGQVLVTGSAQWTNTSRVFGSETAELYDPAEDTWRETAERPQFGTPWQHTTTLEDGRLLVVGAGGYAEIFNPANETWEAVPSPLFNHGGSDSVRLPDGRVMVTGGRRRHADKTQVMVFNPFAGANGDWSYTASLDVGRHNVTGLSDGRVLAGGGEFGEVYTPVPGAVSGTVTDGQGEALAGAEVTVTDSGGEQAASTTTNADGAYRVDEVGYGVYTISANADGHESASKDVRVVAGPNAADFALTAATAGGGGGAVGGGVADAGAGTGQVDGTVTDTTSGEAVAGAEVAVADEAGSVVVTAGTDATGTYSVTGLSEGSYLLTATADGYQSGSQEVTVEAGGTVTADFALQSAETVGRLEGAVVDAATGQALPGVTVTVADDTGAEVVAARTDAEGVYSVENLPPSGYTLTAEVDGYESASQDVTVEAGQTATADFALQPAGTGDGTGAAGLGGSTSEELVAAACDPSVVPEAGFGDVAGSVHADSVACVAWYGLALGLGDVDGDGQDDYGPGLPVSRAQMASFISRLAGEAGVALPENPADAFGDDDGSVHETPINQLAELGLVKGVADGSYAPQAAVSRAQMASFLARLTDQAGLALPENPADAFGDDDGSVHEDNINALAAANVTQGVAEGAYGPNGPVSRGQMASFLGRMLGGFVDAGAAPAGGAEVALADTETAPGGQLAGQATSNKQVVGLVANGCGLDEQPVEVSDGDFTVAVPQGQAGGECDLVLAVTTSRGAGSDAPTQTVQYAFPVTIASSGGE